MSTATLTKQAGKMPVQINAFLSWPEILNLIKTYKNKIILQIPTKQIKQDFTPREETIFLENTGLYTDEFIKTNERVKNNTANTMVCHSIKKLRKNLIDKNANKIS